MACFTSAARDQRVLHRVGITLALDRFEILPLSFWDRWAERRQSHLNVLAPTP
jgi:hypothetical protein